MKKTPAATKVTTSAQNSADSTELALVPTKTEPRVDSRLLAKQLGGHHAGVFELVTNYRADFEQLGVVRFQTEKPMPSTVRRLLALVSAMHCCATPPSC